MVIRTDEQGAIETLRKRLHLVPSFSERMLREKIFSTGLESDIEFRLVSFATAPLYKDVFDSDAALNNALAGTYNAEAHSEFGWSGVISEPSADVGDR